MKKVKKALSSTSRFVCKGKKKIVSATIILMAPMASFANNLLENQDIIELLMNSALGKTIGKNGMIWGVLMGIALLIAAGKAVFEGDPRKFIPAFVVVAIIAAIVGFVITF